MNKAKLVIKKGNLKVVLFFEEPVMVVKTVIQAKGCAVSRFPLDRPSRRFFDPFGAYLPIKSANKTAIDFINGKYFSSKLWRLICGTFNKCPLALKQRMFGDVKENLSLKILEDALKMILKRNSIIDKSVLA